MILATAGNAASLAGLFVALWYTRNTIFAVSVYAGLQVVYIALWLGFAYRVAQFSLRSLVLLARDGLVAGLISVAVIGTIHAALPIWLAAALSTVAVAIIDVFYFMKYFPKTAMASAIARLRRFWKVGIWKVGISRGTDLNLNTRARLTEHRAAPKDSQTEDWKGTNVRVRQYGCESRSGPNRSRSGNSAGS